MVASPLGEAQAAHSCPNCSVISFGVETGDDDWIKQQHETTRIDDGLYMFIYFICTHPHKIHDGTL